MRIRDFIDEIISPADTDHTILDSATGEKSSKISWANIKAALALIFPALTVNDDTKDPTGWVDPSQVNVSYDSVTRIITLSGNLDYYWRGVKKTLTSPWYSDPHDDVTGTGYFLSSSDGETFGWSTAKWDFHAVMVAFVSYGASNKFALREPHGLMPWLDHEESHDQLGTYKVSGGVLTVGSYVLSSTTAADRRPLVDTTVIKDEDIVTTLAPLGAETYTRMALTGAGVVAMATGATDIAKLSGNQPYYDQFTGGVWTETLMATNSWMSVWLIAIPVTDDATSQEYRYVWMRGQSNGNESQERSKTVSDLNFGNLTALSTEWIPIARVLIKYIANWTIEAVEVLSGNKQQAIGSPAGNYLASVATNFSLTGTGTSGDPLKMATDPRTTDLAIHSKFFTGGGTITWNASGYLLWTTRFICLGNGRNAAGDYSADLGYFDITCPTSGTITGVGGAANVTATAAGIPLTAWQSLYYILPIGGIQTSLPANFRVVYYNADLDIPSHWIKIATYNQDMACLNIFNGITLKLNQSINMATHSTPSPTLTSPTLTGTASAAAITSTTQRLGLGTYNTNDADTFATRNAKGCHFGRTFNATDSPVAGVYINYLLLPESLGANSQTIIATANTSNRVWVGYGAYNAAPTWAELITTANFSSITGLGTVTTGTWNASVINSTYGGTGVNNGGRTITIAGNFATAGAFATTLTATAITNVTLPTTGTLATLAGTETLSAKTLASPAITGAATIPDFSSVTMNGSTTNQVIWDSATNYAQTPLARLWHNLFSFCKLYTPTFETSVDGAAWVGGTLNKSLFNNIDNQSITVLSNPTNKAVRWTWNNVGLNYCFAYWVTIGFTYMNAVSTSKTITIERSVDGTTGWTVIHTSTNSNSSAVAHLAIPRHDLFNGLRITITWNSGYSDIGISNIKLLTSRPGNQGYGSELEFPYTWDKDQNVTFPAAVTALTLNKVTITAPATAATLTIANSKTFTVNNTITLAGTDSTTITLPSTTGTVALNNQTFYIGTTQVAINRASAGLTLAGITLTAPVLGAATATSINGLGITTTTGVLTVTNAKTLSVSNTLTLAGTDGSTLNIGTGGTLGTMAYAATSSYVGRQSTSAAAVSIASQGGGDVVAVSNGAAMMSFHRPGLYAVNFGLDTDNVLKVGGWSMGAVSYAIQDSRNKDTAYNSFGNGTMPVRHSSGYLFSNYFNCTADVTATAASHFAIQTASDNYIRWQTPANAKVSLGLGNVTNESKATMFSQPSFTNSYITINSAGDLDTTGSAYVAFHDSSTGSPVQRGWMGFGYADGNVDIYNGVPGKSVSLNVGGTRVLTASSTGIVSTGRMDAASASGAGGYISTGNYGGTGSAAYFPSGIWSNSAYAWIYGIVTFNGPLSGATRFSCGTLASTNRGTAAPSGGSDGDIYFQYTA